jgi:hypothetical protein
VTAKISRNLLHARLVFYASRHADFLERNPAQRDQVFTRLDGREKQSAEKQTFWNEFFQVFGVSRRAMASFEESVKKISDVNGDFDPL